MQDSPPSRLSGCLWPAPPVCDQSWKACAGLELDGANLTWLADLRERKMFNKFYFNIFLFKLNSYSILKNLQNNFPEKQNTR
jgi:hypothetical protein